MTQEQRKQINKIYHSLIEILCEDGIDEEKFNYIGDNIDSIRSAL